MQQVTKVTYEERGGYMQIRVYGKKFANGYTVTDSVQIRNGKARETLLKQAKQKAKMLGVPFENLS